MLTGLLFTFDCIGQKLYPNDLILYCNNSTLHIDKIKNVFYNTLNSNSITTINDIYLSTNQVCKISNKIEEYVLVKFLQDSK